MRKKKSKPPKKHDEHDLTKLADAAFKQAAVKVVERAKRFGTPVVIWRDGQIEKLRPQDIEVPSPKHKRKRG